MVPLLGKPLVQYQVELVKRYGFEEIIFVVNHLGHVLEDYFGDGSKFGIPISYFHESEPLGTVGGVKELEAQLPEDFLVLYGDVMMEMDFNRLLAFHASKKSEATLVVHPNDHPYDSDLVELDETARVVKVLPKPHAEGLQYHNMVNAAAYVFSPRIFNFLEKGKKADFGKDIFPAVFDKVAMYGYNTPEYLKDMGTPDRLEQVEGDIKSGKVARRSLSHKQRAIFLDRDGVLNHNRDLIHKPEDLELYDFSAAAVKTINKSDFISVLVTNQSVVARNLTTIDGLGEIHKKLETELGNDGAKLDDLYFCPHHPDKGYPEENPDYKIDCDCRKPKPGMLLQAAEAFNIDLSQSYMVGDMATDIQAGQAAGCKTIGVMTGFGLRKSKLIPDYFFANIKEAVDFVIHEPYKAQAKAVLHKVKEADKSRFVISVGGNSRSGKSTFSSYLKQCLEAESYSVLRINLDDWIRPKAERETKEEVFFNFNIEKLQADIKAVLNGETIKLNAYRPHTLQAPLEKEYRYQQEQVIIIEGVVALANEALRNLSDFSVFCKIEEALLKERIYHFYKWKGYETKAIDELWKERLASEYKLIAETEKFGDLVV